jgi:phosphoglycerate dehydrogenase-like enzyme
MILLLESLHPEAEALLAAVGPVLRATAPNAPPDELVPPGTLARVRAILTRGRGCITAELLARCPELAVIARAGAGLDNLDLAAASRRGVRVVHAPGANTRTVAEHTLALLLALARGVPRGARLAADGRREERAGDQGNQLAGLALGHVGVGTIGRRVAALAAAFEMRVLVAAHPERALECAYPVLPLGELLAAADVVSLHLPLTPATRGIVGAAELARMRPGALLVNTARGALIDGTALRAALASGRLGGFAADVLDVEPPAADDPLLGSERVVLTPHVASLTAATYRELCLSTAANVARVLAGAEPDPRSVWNPDG